MKGINFILGAAIASMLAGCSTTPIVLNPVGPPPPGATAPPHQGYLQVYTPTEARNEGEDTYYPHSGYHIYTASGVRWKHVPNRIDTTDESPMVVVLPAGNYKIVARADGYGRITVPVVINGGTLTEVNLETWNRKKTPPNNEAAVVQLPNGYVVGWRAEPRKGDTQ